MKKVFITGVAGFIGSHLGQRLLKNDWLVTGLDDLNDYYSPILKRFNLSFLENKRFQFIKGDITDQKLVFDLIKVENPDFLVHCAARAGVRASVKDPFLYTKVNVMGTVNLLEGLRIYSPETRTILVSSSSVYGIQDKTPFLENMTPSPKSPYGASKYAMEIVARQYFDFYGLPIVVVRPFSIYGPRGRVDMAPFLMIKAAEQGKAFIKFGSSEDNKRDWTYIDDFIDGLIKVLENYQFKEFEIFNFGNNKPIGIDQFVELEKRLIKKYLGKNLRVKEKPRGKEELPITYADIEKAKRLIGFNPQTDFSQGLEKFFQFYVANRGLYLKVQTGNSD